MERYNERNLCNQILLKKSKSKCTILEITELLLTCYTGLLDQPLLGGL